MSYAMGTMHQDAAAGRPYGHAATSKVSVHIRFAITSWRLPRVFENQSRRLFQISDTSL